MKQMDRLSALLSRFHIGVTVAPQGGGNMLIIGQAGSAIPTRIELQAEPYTFTGATGEIALLELRADWGGQANPLLRALRKQVALTISKDTETQALVRVVLAEAQAQRCGVDTVLSRLGEVIFVRLIRAEIDRGIAKVGLLAGLADTRINKALVALHEQPGRSWRNDELAELAGLSLSRFADVFHARLGQTPQSYLRFWRMTLAHQDIQRGDRIKSVSHRYGYASSEALARAFQRQFGKPPLAAREEVQFAQLTR
jgi:AraC-like DNA-binding protein